MKQKFININQLLSNQIIILFFVVTINFLAHFLLFKDFGLYEDDHFRVPQAMEMNWQQISELIKNNLFKPEYTQGRPLHIIFIYLFSYLGAKLTSLNGIYLLGFVITSINVILIYTLLWRICHHNLISLIGSLCFILFPADTTKIWLTSLFGLQTSLTFLLLAFHLYLFQNQILSNLSYLTIILSLVTYETPFFIFLTAPLLAENQIKKLYLKIFKHSIILLLILILVTFWRSINGESRVVGIDISQSIQKSLLNMFVGSGVSIKSVFDASFHSLNSIIQYSKILILIIPIVFIYFLFLRQNFLSIKKDISRIDLKLIILGLIMLILAYPLTLNLSATETHGTWSRIHLSSTIGFTFLGSGIFSLFLNVSQKFRFNIAIFLFISLLFGLLLNYKIFIQKDYVLNWKHQKEFWQEITPLISDIEEGDLIFFDRENLNISTKEMRSNHWSTAPILNNLYHFPSDWKYIPQVYLLAHDWQENIMGGNNLFLLNSSVLEGADALLPLRHFDSTISSEKVILIKSVDGKLTRIKSPLIIQNEEFDLKNNSIRKHSFPQKYLSQLMLN